MADVNAPQKKLWFKAKKYGYGWYPVSWQGWVITLIYTAIIVFTATHINARAHSVSDFLINFGFIFIIATIVFIAICRHKGEVAHWHWGDTHDDAVK